MDAIRKIQTIESDKIILDVSKYKGKQVEVIILPFVNEEVIINDEINEEEWAKFIQ